MQARTSGSTSSASRMGRGSSSTENIGTTWAWLLRSHCAFRPRMAGDDGEQQAAALPQRPKAKPAPACPSFSSVPALRPVQPLVASTAPQRRRRAAAPRRGQQLDVQSVPTPHVAAGAPDAGATAAPPCSATPEGHPPRRKAPSPLPTRPSPQHCPSSAAVADRREERGAGAGPPRAVEAPPRPRRVQAGLDGKSPPPVKETRQYERVVSFEAHQGPQYSESALRAIRAAEAELAGEGAVQALGELRHRLRPYLDEPARGAEPRASEAGREKAPARPALVDPAASGQSPVDRLSERRRRSHPRVRAQARGQFVPPGRGAELLDQLRTRLPTRLSVDDRGTLRHARPAPPGVLALGPGDRQVDTGLSGRGVRVGTTVGRAGHAVHAIPASDTWASVGLPLPRGFLRDRQRLWREDESIQVRAPLSPRLRLSQAPTRVLPRSTAAERRVRGRPHAADGPRRVASGAEPPGRGRPGPRAQCC